MVLEDVMSVQAFLVEALLDTGLGTNARLSPIDALIDGARLDRLLSGMRRKETGRPPYPALSMLKALYPQALYDLSDPGMEEALLDRLSFRRLCGLGIDAGRPDETTICRFRAMVSEGGVMDACFAEIALQLDAKGLVLRKGTLLDASIVASAHRPPAREAGMCITHPREPGADWTAKGGKTFFGYKIHVGVDAQSGLIRRALLTPVRLLDGQAAEDLISGDEAAVYADRALESKKRRATLKAAGIKDRIMHRRHKHMPVLPRWMAVRNRLIARRRAPVEAVLSAMKRIYGKARARCHSLKRNATDFIAFATVYNLTRSLTLLQRA
jgi:IS5 family transposase